VLAEGVLLVVRIVGGPWRRRYCKDRNKKRKSHHVEEKCCALLRVLWL